MQAKRPHRTKQIAQLVSRWLPSPADFPQFFDKDMPLLLFRRLYCPLARQVRHNH
jgi:hypothetical protein